MFDENLRRKDNAQLLDEKQSKIEYIFEDLGSTVDVQDLQLAPKWCGLIHHNLQLIEYVKNNNIT